MDEYSFISENGTVRQIRDLMAKEKDEEQDGKIAQLEAEMSVVNKKLGAIQLFTVGVGAANKVVVPKDGFLIFSFNLGSGSSGNVRPQVNVNGVLVSVGANDTTATYSFSLSTLTLPVCSGDVVYLTTSAGITSYARFYESV